MNRCILLIILLTFSRTIYAQDTLPNFSVKDYGNKRYIIGWVNTYGLVKQISIQRSHDSLKNYTTIMSVADPNARQNGFADAKAPNDHMFYRLFVVLDKGQFYFTEAKKPVFDSIRSAKKVTIDYQKDTVVTTNIKPVIPKKPDFIPSFFVYTNRDGYVYINLPDADRKKYHIKFYEDNDTFLFELKNIRETGLTLDKTNFIHAGWFKFELYNDDELVEKNKFFLPREF
jgi:hypothetical protein